MAQPNQISKLKVRGSAHDLPILNLWPVVLLAGQMIACLSYGSAEPLVLSLSLLCIGLCLMQACGLGASSERTAFTVMFAVGTFAGGINAVYLNQLNSPDWQSDGFGNFIAATENFPTESITQLRLATEGALSTFVWRNVYDAWAFLGGDRGMYVGIVVNCLLTSLSASLGVRVVRHLFGDKAYRLRQMALLCGTCGLLMLCAGTHLRESFLLLVLTGLICAWTSWLAVTESTTRVVFSAFMTAVATVAFDYLRTEFVPLPAIIAATALATAVGFQAPHRPRVVFSVVLLLLVFLLAAILLGQKFLDYLFNASNKYVEYQELGALTHSADSLGMALVVNQPILLRIPIGSIYILLSPIPVWGIFVGGTAYDLFLGLRAVQFYFVLPVILLAVYQLRHDRSLRTPAIMFVSLAGFGFLIALAASSLEGRHLAPLVMPLLVLATLPDLRIRRVWKNYQRLTLGMLVIMALIHVAWLIIKL